MVAHGRADIAEALRRLDVERLLLGLHQPSFPAAEDDLGHGAPASSLSTELLRQLQEHGFTGILLGPAGIVSPHNPSPYDGTLFSLSPLTLSFKAVKEGPWRALVDDALFEQRVEQRPPGARVDYAYAHAATSALLRHAATVARGQPAVGRALAQLRRDSAWLEPEARFEAIAAATGTDDWRRWPPGAPEDPTAALSFELGQLWAEEQHREVRRVSHNLGLALYGDAQIGVSHRDLLIHRGLFLERYVMGAPPSRTNPDGQPWGYPVLDPRQLAPGGAARGFVERRLQEAFRRYDGLRVDHPQGWICPWVYRSGAADPHQAVRAGARLHESPHLAEDPLFEEVARVRAEQLDRQLPPYHDDWVRWLEASQIDAYAEPFRLLLDQAAAMGVGRGALMVEVLSTCPRPLAAVLERFGLGRFRVTQKARVEDPTDVYRGDRAAPQDWIMLGNHDTPPLRLIVDQWQHTKEAARRAAYLAQRLATGEQERALLSKTWEHDSLGLAQAMMAELFLGPSRNVLVFWLDWLGGDEPYNRPGLVDPRNWTLRMPQDLDEAYSSAQRAKKAPSLPRALAWALIARRIAEDDTGKALVARLSATGAGAPEGPIGPGSTRR